jgi:hypothetical protein
MTDYYGQPVIKKPVWTPEIPTYFFFGGMAGASAGLAYLAELSGNDVLARRAWGVSLVGITASPPLLISDLGVPSRFLNMLRMFKVTSPMSVGSWILSGSGTTTGIAATHTFTGLFGGLARVAKPGAALLGLPLSTYTGALIANTSVPVWHEARRTLPLLFASGAAASAGAATSVFTPVRAAGPARRLALIGAVGELAATQVMERRLGPLARPYKEGTSGKLSHAATALTAVGGLVLARWGRRRRSAAVFGGAALLAGAATERFAVFHAGIASAQDPQQTVGPQRERVEARRVQASAAA